MSKNITNLTIKIIVIIIITANINIKFVCALIIQSQQVKLRATKLWIEHTKQQQQQIKELIAKPIALRIYTILKLL